MESVCDCPNGPVVRCLLESGHGRKHVGYATTHINGEKIEYKVTWWR